MVYPRQKYFRTIGVAENINYALVVVIIDTPNNSVFKNGVFLTRKLAPAEELIINRTGNRKQYLQACYLLAATSRSLPSSPPGKAVFSCMLGYQNCLDEANAAKLTCRSLTKVPPWLWGIWPVSGESCGHIIAVVVVHVLAAAHSSSIPSTVS
jgi:hypothetical protein